MRLQAAKPGWAWLRLARYSVSAVVAARPLRRNSSRPVKSQDRPAFCRSRSS